ncbi:hypothetical protein NDN11_13970 [Acinetobacter sp. C26M]|uniref:hypothetical protein n=1 Tax=unclassified Acinetobacter TaxID=196816 RepID=UPI0020372DAE|nr:MULTISPECIES: hypothetical protein [unclassified Acinetobacter]USA45808.1 hypothetical protein NDN11_13970 [Acinetobacter sp. C26M]USA49291.1 hypothetical protein NDN12_13885 [Acinetobacter sp. C26G]
MKAKQEILDLLSLLKVFDANYVSDEDCLKLHGLDVNKPEDVITAVKVLLLPEFHTYSQVSQQRLITLLHATILDSSEDFITLFDRIELAFDNEIIDKRTFISALLAGIECV